MTTRNDSGFGGSRLVVGLISAFLALVGDRIVVAVQIENARTRIMVLEQTQRDQDEMIRMIRSRQVENENRIQKLEDKP